MRSSLLMAATGLLLLGGSMSGCGLRGDLYLEEDQAATARPDRRESLREQIGRQTEAEPDPVEFDTGAMPNEAGAAEDRATENSDDGKRPRTGPAADQPATAPDSAEQP